MSPTTDKYQRASSTISMAFRGRSVLSFGRNQVVSMDQIDEEELHHLDRFQSHVTTGLKRIADDKISSPSPVISLAFLHKLIDLFLSCDEQFTNMLRRSSKGAVMIQRVRIEKSVVSSQVKSLDVCNEMMQNLQEVRHWNRYAGIAAAVVPGQVNRARRALSKLVGGERKGSGRDGRAGALSRSWSVGKHLRAMSGSLVAPRDDGEAGGLAHAVYTMSSVMVFTMLALVASFPGASTSISTGPSPVGPPRHLAWAPTMIGLQERIGEVSKRRGRNKGGVLAEFLEVERCGRALSWVCEAKAGSEAEVKEIAGELGEASKKLEAGLGALERRLREVFHRVVKSREEVMKSLEESRKSSADSFLVL